MCWIPLAEPPQCQELWWLSRGGISGCKRAFCSWKSQRPIGTCLWALGCKRSPEGRQMYSPSWGSWVHTGAKPYLGNCWFLSLVMVWVYLKGTGRITESPHWPWDGGCCPKVFLKARLSATDFLLLADPSWPVCCHRHPGLCLLGERTLKPTWMLSGRALACVHSTTSCSTSK